MKQPQTGQWAYGHDEERFHGAFDTREEAIAEGLSDVDDCDFGVPAGVYVGRIRLPVPELGVRGRDIIDSVKDMEDFHLEAAEDAMQASRPQVDDLTAMLRATFAEWMDKHGLRPQFFLVDKPEWVEAPAPPEKA